MSALADRSVRLVVPLLSLFLLVRWSPHFMQTESGDPAYTFSYHHIFLTAAQYGIDVLHTGGPWSILYFTHYHPQTFLLSLAGQAVVALVLGLVIADVAVRCLRSTLIRFAFSAAMLALLTVAVDARYFFLGLAAIAYMPDFGRQRVATLHLAIMAVVALSVLVKSSFFIVGGVVLAMTALEEAVRYRKVPLNAFIFVLMVGALHLASGQSAAAFGAYVSAILEVASAYPEFLSELGSYWELAAFAGFVAVLAAMVLYVEVQRSHAWGILIAGAYGAIVFVAYKQGFMRQDGQHVIRSFCTIFTFGAVYALLHRQILARLFAGNGAEWPPPLRFRRGAAAFGMLSVVCLVGYLLIQNPSLYNTKIDRLAAQAMDLWHLVSSGRETFDERHAAAKARIRANYPLPEIDGSLAAFSSFQTVAMVHDADYRVLPTTAAQLIWTPKLDAANAAFFSGSHAPDYVIGHRTYTNRRSAVEMLRHYRPAGFLPDMYLLARGARRVAETEPLGGKTIRWGEKIRVPEPAGGLVLVKLTYRRTIWGTILNILYQPARAYLVLDSGSGVIARYLIGRSLAAKGLLISPAPRTVAEVAAMASDEGLAYMNGRPTKTIHLEAGEAGSWLFPLGSWGRYFEPEVEVEFERLRFAQSDFATWDRRSPEMAAFRRLLLSRPVLTGAREAPQLELYDGKRAAIGLYPDRAVAFNLLGGTRALKGEFVLSGDDADPVSVRIAIRRDGAETSHATGTYKPNREDGGVLAIEHEFEPCAATQDCQAVLSIEEAAERGGSPVYLVDWSLR